MRSVKKLPLLMAALAVVVAFAAPTMAQAAPEPTKWSLGGVELKENGTNKLTGMFGINLLSGLGGVQCPSSELTIDYKAQSGEGSFSSVALKGCQYIGFMSTVCGTTAIPTLYVMPWAAQAQKEPGVRWINVALGASFKPESPGANCPSLAMTITSSKAILVPNSLTYMTSFGWGGTVSTLYGTAKVEGKLTASGTNFYGML